MIARQKIISDAMAFIFNGHLVDTKGKSEETISWRILHST
jgi:hypothetical protein